MILILSINFGFMFVVHVHFHPHSFFFCLIIVSEVNITDTVEALYTLHLPLSLEVITVLNLVFIIPVKVYRQLLHMHVCIE